MSALSAMRSSHRRGLYVLILIFLVISLAAGLAPSDRAEWWEGNIPIIALLLLLIVSYRWWPLSTLSYSLLTVFLILATIGAHFTYESSPVGVAIGRWLSIVRNPYDRVVHFGAGLLLFYPVYENLPRIARARAPFSHLLSIAILLAASALWEIAEVYYGIGIHQNPGYAGTEDLFDSQHDMAMALLGSITAMTITACIQSLRRVRNSG